jgi:hypothetical protein
MFYFHLKVRPTRLLLHTQLSPVGDSSSSPEGQIAAPFHHVHSVVAINTFLNLREQHLEKSS